MPYKKPPPQSIHFFSPEVPEEGACASIILATLEIFPEELLKSLPIDWQTLQSSLISGRLSHEGLLTGAYLGLMPIAGTHRRFTTDSEKYFKEVRRRSGVGDPRRNCMSRKKITLQDENAAAQTWGVTGDEMKLLYKELNNLANSKGFASFREVFECNKDILAESLALDIFDHPTDRYTFALGPRYLWQMAKFAAQQELKHVAFAVHLGWMLFLHADDKLVRGYALQPRTLRFGNRSFNRAVDFESMRDEDKQDLPVFPAPASVKAAAFELAESRFPNQAFELMPHPTWRCVNQIADRAL